tara:strand:+ start:248 stop:439 length:192 start_codon:yes stop_codon:yes gene_type:complete
MINNKKIYTLVICFNEDTEEVEWLQETIEKEEELPGNIFETKDLTEFGKYLKNLPDITEVGEA